MLGIKKAQSKVFPNDLKELDKTNEEFNISKQKIDSNKQIMTLCQTVSFQRSRTNQAKKAQIQHEKQQDPMKESKRLKIPSLLKKTLHQQAIRSGKVRRIRHILQKPKDGQMISQKVEKQYQQCEICLGQMDENQKVKISSCNHFFCASCINQYILYKIKMFQEIVCPNEQCQLIIDQQNNFYKSLPDDTKIKYIKIHNFYKTSKDPNLRLCPRQNCEGVIKIVQNQPIICNKCLKQLCPKCYFEKHQGLCDQNQINFFQNNLHYRQCSKCKLIIEKISGCNHMTCRCKYQFCYVCGGKWSQNHLCNKSLVVPAVIQNNSSNRCCDCDWADQCCSIMCFLKFPLRIIVWLLLLLVFQGYYVLKFIFKHTGLFIGAFFIGMTWYTKQQLWKGFKDSLCIGMILLTLFPIPLIMGIVKGLKQIWLNAFIEDCQQIAGIFVNLTTLVYCQ